MMKENEKKWSYVSPIDGKTTGPFSTKEMKEEIRSKGLASSVLIFSYDLVPAEWTPLCKIQLLRDSIETEQLLFEKTYYYLDGTVQKGPFSVAELRTKLQNNEIDGLTQMWSMSRGNQWVTLSECEDLKALIYGNGDNLKKRKRSSNTTATKKKKKKKKKVKNNWIYITGLDKDVDVEMLVKMFSKYGLIDESVLTNEPKVKIYRNEETQEPKGDASICFVKEPSVELAISMMDEVEYKPGFKLSISRAVWQRTTTNNNNNSEEEKKPKWQELMTEVEYKARVEAKRKRLNAKLAWTSDAYQRTVILRNVFDRDELRSKPLLMEQLKKDMKAGASEFGKLKSLKVAENNPEGIVILNFKFNASANPCVEKMNGRFYGGRKISAALWDGYTNHVVEESEEEKEKREKDFGAWLETVSSTPSKKEEESNVTHIESMKEKNERESNHTNILEEYTEKIMNFLMSPDCNLSEEMQDKISEKLDEAAEWMIENRSLLHDVPSLKKKMTELENSISPMLVKK